jgi:DNA-binding transcriptional LysR family regulator
VGELELGVDAVHGDSEGPGQAGCDGLNSISQAAVNLGCSKSVVSRQLARLESDLGTRLLQRSTRRLTLTEVGQLILSQAQQIDRAVANIEQLSGQYQQEVGGMLRVTCPRPLSQLRLMPLLVEFTERHPKVEVALTVADRMVDLIAEHVDVAIRVAHLEDSSLVARKLIDTSRVLVAAPAYLQRRRMPNLPQDLLHHDCLVYASGARVFDEWGFLRDGSTTMVQVRGRIQIDDGMALVAAARAGGGVLLIDSLMVADEMARGQLVPVLPEYSLRAGQPIYLVYPARSWLDYKTSVFIHFLQERLFA